MQFKRITFFGFSDAKPEDKLYKDVFEIAALVAKEGYEIVNGGGPGLMRASTQGAKSVGGKAIGVTFDPQGMTFFEGRDPENEVDELIQCKDYVERTLKLLELGDAYLTFNGGTGTLSEFGMAWAMARLYYGHSKRFILYGGFWYPVMEEITRLMMIRKEELELYKIAVQPDEVVTSIHEFEGMVIESQHHHERKSPYAI